MRVFVLLWVAALALGPSATPAQSPDQVRSFQNFEAAKASGKTAEALEAGKEAVRLTGMGADEAQLIELLRNVGDYAAQVGADEQANGYYIRALGLQEAALGINHPDLVPVLTAL